MIDFEKFNAGSIVEFEKVKDLYAGPLTTFLQEYIPNPGEIASDVIFSLRTRNRQIADTKQLDDWLYSRARYAVEIYLRYSPGDRERKNELLTQLLNQESPKE